MIVASLLDATITVRTLLVAAAAAAVGVAGGAGFAYWPAQTGWALAVLAALAAVVAVLVGTGRAAAVWWWVRRHGPAELVAHGASVAGAWVAYGPLGPIGAAIAAQVVATAAFYTVIIGHDLAERTGPLRARWSGLGRRLLGEFGWAEAGDNVIRTVLLWAGPALLLAIGAGQDVAVTAGTWAGGIVASVIFYSWAGYSRRRAARKAPAYVDPPTVEIVHPQIAYEQYLWQSLTAPPMTPPVQRLPQAPAAAPALWHGVIRRTEPRMTSTNPPPVSPVRFYSYRPGTPMPHPPDRY